MATFSAVTVPFITDIFFTLQFAILRTTIRNFKNYNVTATPQNYDRSFAIVFHFFIYFKAFLIALRFFFLIYAPTFSDFFNLTFFQILFVDNTRMMTKCSSRIGVKYE